jgi:hypothetical protein
VKVVVTDVAAIASLLLHTRSDAGRGVGLSWIFSEPGPGWGRDLPVVSSPGTQVLALGASNC